MGINIMTIMDFVVGKVGQTMKGEPHIRLDRQVDVPGIGTMRAKSYFLVARNTTLVEGSDLQLDMSLFGQQDVTYVDEDTGESRVATYLSPLWGVGFCVRHCSLQRGELWYATKMWCIVYW